MRRTVGTLCAKLELRISCYVLRVARFLRVSCVLRASCVPRASRVACGVLHGCAPRVLGARAAMAYALHGSCASTMRVTVTTHVHESADRSTHSNIRGRLSKLGW